MGNTHNNTRVAKNTLMLYIRMLLIMAVSLYTSRVILSTLGVEDFGIYGVVAGVIWMFSFVTNSMSNATQRFITYELGSGNFDSLQEVFCISVQVYALLAFLILFLGETIGLWFVSNYLTIPADRFEAAMWVYHASVLTCCFTIITIPFNATIIAHERMSAFAYISIFEVFAKLGIVYVLSLFSIDKLKLYSTLILCVQLTICLIYQIYARRKFTETKFKFCRNRVVLNNMLGFAGWTLVGNLAVIGYTQGLNMLLNIFFGPIVNAARAIAVQVEGVVNGFVSNFQTALNPQITKSYASKDMEHMHSLVFGSCRYSFFLLFFIGVPIFIEAPLILNLWLKQVPDYTVSFLRITLIGTLIGTQSNPIMTAVSATGVIRKYQIYVGCALLLVLPLSYIVLQFKQIPELVLLVFLSCLILAQIIRMLLVRKIASISLRTYLKTVLLPIFKVMLVSLIPPTILSSVLDSSIPSSLVIVLSFVTTSLFAVYYWGIGEQERVFIINKIKRILPSKRN